MAFKAAALPVAAVAAACLMLAGQTLDGVGFAVLPFGAQTFSRSHTKSPASAVSAVHKVAGGQTSLAATQTAMGFAALAVLAGFARRSGRAAARTRCRAGEPLMPWKIPNTSRWQWLSVRELLLRERILMVTEYIDENAANAYIAMLLYLQSEDAQKPVQIYFSSPGAQMKPALALYDTIVQLKSKGCKITTVNYALCVGMGAFLMAAGTKGRRFTTPNSMFLLTKTGLESPFQGQAEDILIETIQMLKECDRIEAELSEITGQTREKIEKDLSRNFYLTAEKAMEYGLVDKVLVPETDKGKRLDEGQRDPWSGSVTKTKVGFGEFADPNQPRTAV